MHILAIVIQVFSSMGTSSKIIIILSLLASVGLMSRCAINSHNDDDYTFAWDMSVENHTGVPKNNFDKDGKHRGMSIFNLDGDKDQWINQLVKNNIECAALVPFLYQRTDTTKIIRQRDDYTSWSTYDSMYIDIIDRLHERQLHVMLKPHLWMNEGWRSNIKLDNDQEWDVWFDSYRNHMLHYARIAQDQNVELYCIGTEFNSSINRQPDRWLALVHEIKAIYSGKLTYAANWDGEFRNVQFWDEMDYIGIQAYFPLTSKDRPSLREIKNGWKKHKQMLRKLSEVHDKPILFTETGYRSDQSATIKPWEWSGRIDTLNDITCYDTQNLAYEALFQELWREEWFAGMYFWQWHTETKETDRHERNDFTPRFKPAENTMAKWYGQGI